MGETHLVNEHNYFEDINSTNYKEKEEKPLLEFTPFFLDNFQLHLKRLETLNANKWLIADDDNLGKFRLYCDNF